MVGIDYAKRRLQMMDTDYLQQWVYIFPFDYGIPFLNNLESSV